MRKPFVHSRRFPSPRREHGRRGVATVELALVLPFLVFLFVVAVDFSRINHDAAVLSSCARTGAYYASDPDLEAILPYASVQEAVLADATDLPTPPTVTVTTGQDSLGLDYVDVRVDYTFYTVTRFPGIPRVWPLTRTVRMRSVNE